MLAFIAAQKERLDKFIASQTSVSRSVVQRAIKSGKVLVNGKVETETDFQVKEGDSVSLPEFKEEKLKPYDFDLKVVFENEDVVVIDKPAGLVVHPGAGNMEKTLANILISKYPNIRNVGDPHRPGIVHRLDEDTSGLILIAKNPKSFEYFKNLFVERKIEKEYLTLVHGVPAKMHDMIDAPLEKVPLKQKMKVGSGKPAVTEYWVLQTGFLRNAEFISASQNKDPETSSGLREDQASLQVALLRVKLHTGRSHQIRAHLSHIGHPVVGDQIYGKKKDSALISRPARLASESVAGRQFLHAYRLKFQLPDKTWIELESELPQDLQTTLNKLGIKYDHKF